MQVTADAYEKLDKELLGYVEDVLLNRREDATERILEYAATLDPKSKPTAIKRIGGESDAPGASTIPARQNPAPGDGLQAIAAPAEMPPVPEYKPFVDTLRKSEAFEQVGSAQLQGKLSCMISEHGCCCRCRAARCKTEHAHASLSSYFIRPSCVVSCLVCATAWQLLDSSCHAAPQGNNFCRFCLLPLRPELHHICSWWCCAYSWRR